MKKQISLLTLLASATIFSSVAFGSNTIAEALGWKTTPSPRNKDDLCGGYYSQPLFVTRTPNPPPYKTVAVTITAKGPVIFHANGPSILQKDVVITQPGRMVHADKAYVYHDKKTGKITDIQLIGHVRVQEAGKLLVGTHADYHIAKNTLTMNNALYHIAGEYDLLTVSSPFNAWGSAKKIYRHANGDIDLTNAKYSTCSPAHPSWIISAKKMQLDRSVGEGYAHNVVIKFKHVPIFYAPYYSFPLNSARKSGLLMPSLGYSTSNGFYASQPYYWNIAPNYDLLFTPAWYSERGIQLNGSFRYLTPKSDGVLYASIIPHDAEFERSSQYKLNVNANSTAPGIAPYLSELKNSGASRAFFDFENNYEFNNDWTAKLYARYVTDPYYAEDFQSEYLTQTTNQIPSFAELNYAGDHWNDTFLIQAYQTLHPLNQFSPSPAQNQYTRLPEWNFSATYPQFLSHFNFNLNGQAVHFDYQSSYLPYTYQMPVGNRLHLQPSISRPFNWSSFFITPQLTADTTTYDSQLASLTDTTPRADYDVNRTLPIFNIDSGLYFDRSATFDGKHYIQTFEPRVFYLYTPYLNQNSYPNFDTQLLPFSTANLYTLNEFSGFDRLQNANQISLGLTSHFLRESDASNVLTAQLGAIDYLEPQRVCLTSQSCQLNDGSLSPIAGALTWSPNTLWSFGTQAAWDTALKQINNAQAGMQYTFSMHHIVLLNYQFVHSNPDAPFNSPINVTPNSSLLTAGLVWPITKRWGFFGYTYYDLTNHHPQNQYVGLSYNTCCWALRFILSSAYNGTTQIQGSPSAFQSPYTTTYYLEFLLKGLGSVGTSRAEDMLTSTLPGFSDVFSNNGHYGYGSGV